MKRNFQSKYFNVIIYGNKNHNNQSIVNMCKIKKKNFQFSQKMFHSNLFEKYRIIF